jgi:hypothetical protein
MQFQKAGRGIAGLAGQVLRNGTNKQQTRVEFVPAYSYTTTVLYSKASPCLDHLKIPSFFTLSPSHQFLAACIEY